VLVTGAARRKHLLDGSGFNGKHAENVAYLNRAASGTYVFLDVDLPARGASSAQYRATVATAR